MSLFRRSISPRAYRPITFSGSMHHALAIVDIIYLIVAQADRRDQVRTARVASVWTEPALTHIWARVDNLRALIHTFPTEILTLGSFGWVSLESLAIVFVLHFLNFCCRALIGPQTRSLIGPASSSSHLGFNGFIWGVIRYHAALQTDRHQK